MVISTYNLIVSESDGYAEFTVRLSTPASSPITVQYDTNTGSASYFSDYNDTYGTLTFAVGTTTQTVRIPLKDDTTVEDTESFSLELYNAKDASGNDVKIANNKLTATIIDNDTQVTDVSQKANLSARDVVVDEKAGTATFDLVLSKATSTNFSVAYSTTNGTATASSDFTAVGGSVTFAAGQTSQRVIVNVVDDSTVEGNEYFHLNLGAITGSSEVLVADGVGTAFIGANDQATTTAPIISASDIIVSESDGYAEFTVRLSAPASSPITVQYDTNMGSASYFSPVDYSDTYGILTFAVGTTTQTVRVPLNSDTTVEDTESFFLELYNAKDASGNGIKIANNKLTATIIDNDTQVTNVSGNGTIDASEKANLSVWDVVVDEQAGTATFDLVLSKATSTNFSVAYSITNGTATASTATASSDFTAAGSSVTFAAGQTSQRVTVNIVDDSTVEGNEYFHLNLGAITGSSEVLVADGVGTAFIGANDQATTTAPIISASDIIVSESDGYAEFTVRLSAPASSPITVLYGTNMGSASYFSPVDYSDTYGTLTFAVGTTTQTVRVPLNNDTTVEDTESFYLALSTARDAGGNVVAIATPKATAYIYDNDSSTYQPMIYGLGNDVYVINSTKQYAAETLNGGIDTVQSSITYSLLDTDGDNAFGANVENLTLTGSAAINGTGNALNNFLLGNSGANTLTGDAGNDALSGGAGNDYLDGGSGLDMAIYSNSRAAYTLAANTGGWDIAGPDGVDTLTSIERLQFSDMKVALDLKPGGDAAQAVEFLGVLAPSQISIPSTVGLILGLLNQGSSLHDVFQLAIDVNLVSQLAGSSSNADMVRLVFRNVVGAEADASAVDVWTSHLDGRVANYSQAAFMTVIAGMEINHTHIGLVGLQQTGIEFA